MRLQKQIYHAAIYLRLSRDDEDKVESYSIQNQRELLKSFIEKDPTLELAQEFSDDGYTGTNFNRPAFQKMMELVDNKVIDCIIVKDLSRLGRNYIETGRYIDQIFPMLGVRFISVNDNYDSIREHNDADDIIIPFKNLINDTYCRDISMKIRSQLDVKRKNGQFIGSFAPYGYDKDPKDKYHLIIDEKAATTVRMVFNMKLEGYNPQRIADKLNEMGVLPPLQYKRAKGLKCNCGYWKGDDPKWYHTSITGILTNEMYLGHMVQGKMRKLNYKLPQCKPIDRKDWVVVKNTHEPIITQDIFDRVQEMLDMDTRTSPDAETVRLYSGFVKCPDCGQNMIIRTVFRGKRRYVYYTCSTNKAGRGCSSHLINAEKLEKTVEAAIKEHVAMLLNSGVLLKKAEDLPKDGHIIKVLDNQIKELDNEISHYNDLQEKLYIDYKEDIIEKDDYDELKDGFSRKLEAAKRSRENVLAKKQEALDAPPISMEWMREIRRLGYVDTITRKLVSMLIEKIIVYDKEHIEIVFRYKDEINYILGQDASDKPEEADAMDETDIPAVTTAFTVATPEICGREVVAV